MREEPPFNYYGANSLLIEAGKPEMKAVYAEAVNAYLAACENLASTDTPEAETLPGARSLERTDQSGQDVS